MNKPEKLSQEIVNLLLPRLQDEYNAFYLYRSASNWCKNVGYFKAAEFFKAESDDELSHAKKIEDYLTDWNVTPILPTVNKPVLSFKNLGEVIQAGYNAEYKLYGEYEDTSLKIFKLGETCTFDFLQFFRETQTKSVAEYSDKLNMLDGCDVNSKFEMLLLEKKLF
jgi:ferritin